MTTYVMTGQTGYGGPFATTAAECAQNNSSFKPARAIDIYNFLQAGQIVRGDRVLLDASIGGPLRPVDAADYVVNGIGLTLPIIQDTNDFPNTGIRGRNIVFGDRTNNVVTQSTANGIAFHATGTDGFNVDMTGIEALGATASRQMAAILIQGIDLDVTGWRIKPSDYNFLATGRIPQANARSATIYPVLASHENIGLLIRGAWGSRVYGNYVEGSLFTTWGIWVQHYCSTDKTINQNKVVRVYNNVAKWCGTYGIRCEHAEGNGITVPSNGTQVLMYNNVASDGRFYASGTNNAAMSRGKLIGLSMYVEGSRRADFYNNEAYGECEDGVGIAYNTNMYGNYVHDICPSFSYAQATLPLKGEAAGSTAAGFASGWDFRADTVNGNGVKLGLSGFDGTGGTGWLVPGTPGGAFSVDEVRNRVFGNRIINVPTNCITSNQSAGMLIATNELVQDARGAGSFPLYFPDRTNMGNQWVANNYIKGPTRGIFGGANNRIYLFNNAIDAPTAGLQVNGTTGSFAGNSNVMSVSAPTYSGGGTSAQIAALAGTVTATPAYTLGTGPTAGGNCDGKGDINGILGARTPFATAQALNRAWDASRLPIGPRQL